MEENRQVAMIKIVVTYTEDMEQLTANRITERLHNEFRSIIPIETKKVTF